MVKRFLLFLFLVAVAAPADATDYTDLWYAPAESGWGANVVQSDQFMFVTFFVYGPDNKPTWYTAQLTVDSSGKLQRPAVCHDGHVLWSGMERPEPYRDAGGHGLVPAHERVHRPAGVQRDHAAGDGCQRDESPSSAKRSPQSTLPEHMSAASRGPIRGVPHGE